MTSPSGEGSGVKFRAWNSEHAWVWIQVRRISYQETRHDVKDGGWSSSERGDTFGWGRQRMFPGCRRMTDASFAAGRGDGTGGRWLIFPAESVTRFATPITVPPPLAG